MRTNKRLGQHFIRCRWVISTLIKTADVKSADTILEIGPGTGILTLELAKIAKRIVAVEKDQRLANTTAEELRKVGALNVQIIPGDIIKILGSPTDLLPDLTPYKVVSNIPYYVTSRLLRLLLLRKPRPELIALTLQKAVAQRICAKPPQMNLLAVLVQSFGRPQIIKSVPAECFYPKPKVESAILKIDRISQDFFSKTGIAEEAFFTVARTIFSQRRKTILNNLSALWNRAASVLLLERAKIAHTKRAEELGLDEISRLAQECTKYL